MSGQASQLPDPSAAELLAVGPHFSTEIWESFNDTGLVGILCQKLENVLTELLARTCHSDDDLIDYYHRKYPDNGTYIRGYHKAVADKQYYGILKNRCKLTLGQLIYELFTQAFPEESSFHPEWATPAILLGLEEGEHWVFKDINKLRNKVAHFGKHTDESTKLGRLSEEELTEVTEKYEWIVKYSRAFESAYPDKLKQMRCDFLDTMQVTQYRAAIHVIDGKLIMREAEMEVEALSANLEDEREKNARLKKENEDSEEHMRKIIMRDDTVETLRRDKEHFERLCNELTTKNQKLEEENAKTLLAASPNITAATEQVKKMTIRRENKLYGKALYSKML